MKFLVTLTAVGAGLAGLVANEATQSDCSPGDCSTPRAETCRPEVSCTPDGTCRIECTRPDGETCWIELDCETREVVDRSDADCGAPADCDSGAGCSDAPKTD